MKENLHNNKFIKRFTKSKFLSNGVSSVKTMFSLGNSKEFSMVMKKYLRPITVFASGLTRVSPRLRHFHKFYVLITKTYKNHGSTYTVKWLKACHTAIQKYIAGEPFTSLRAIEPDLPLPSLINGLPKFIGTMDRKAIRNGHTPTIRLWLSILNLYRIIDSPSKAKLETITKEYGGSVDYLNVLDHCFYTSIKVYRKELESFSLFNIRNLLVDGIRPSLQSGPNSSYALFGILPDALAVNKYSWIISSIRKWCDITRSIQFKNCLDKTINLAMEGRRFDKFYFEEISNIEVSQGKHNSGYQGTGSYSIPMPKIVEEYVPNGKTGKLEPNFVTGSDTDVFAGKLVGLHEAAGKLRIIAIVDIWTQSLFRPLHNTIFRFLRTLPNDGTFNQDASFFRCQDKAKLSGLAYSVDLSAATDRLPIQLQESILNHLFGHSIGTLWKTILRRPFVSRLSMCDDLLHGNSVWYGTGQPMGCLSSWAMLALTHHFILQFCCQNVFGDKRWHECYEILGDDLVIFNKEVYEEYIRVMSLLDVGTNPSKSLISEDTQALEYAKRTSYKGIDVSGLSWKLLISTRKVSDRLNMILSFGIKGIIWKDGLLGRLLLNNTHRLSIKSLSTDALQELLLGLLSHYASKGIISYEDAITYLLDPSKGEESLHECKIPVSKTLHDCLTMLWSIPDYLKDKNYSFDKSFLSLNKVEGRHRLGQLSIFRYLKHNVFEDSISRVFLFEESYERIPKQVASHMIGLLKPEHFEIESHLPSQERFLYRLRGHVFDLAYISLYGFNGNDQGIFDILGRYIMSYENLPDLKSVFALKDKIELYVTRFKLLDKLKRKETIAEETPQWLKNEIRKVTIPEHSVYWKVINDTTPVIHTNPSQPYEDKDIITPLSVSQILSLEDAYMPDASNYGFWSKVGRLLLKDFDKGRAQAYKNKMRKPIPPSAKRKSNT
jgi:hypothetical protein